MARALVWSLLLALVLAWCGVAVAGERVFHTYNAFANSTLSPNTVAILQVYSQVCPDPRFHCSDGYLCIDNLVCLQAPLSRYRPLELLSVGAMLKLIEDNVNVDCLTDIAKDVSDLVNAFYAWQRQQYDDAASYLKLGIGDTLQTFVDCEGKSIWSQIKSMFKKVIAVFAPEVVAAYEIIVNGVNIYEDFAGMMSTCSDAEQDYIGCGEHLGNIINTVYHSISKK